MHIREVCVTYGRRRHVPGGATNVTNAREVVALIGPMLERQVVEVCYMLLLNTRNGLIGYHQLSRGSLTATPVHPREVYQVALLAGAAGIVLVHNHPSGDPTPSAEDVALTRRMTDAGHLLGVELLDHVIIGHGGQYASIREAGRL